MTVIRSKSRALPPHRPAIRPIRTFLIQPRSLRFDRINLQSQFNPYEGPIYTRKPGTSTLQTDLNRLVPASYLPSQTQPTTMPTPESAAFLAKKPTVAPTYDGVDFEDNVAVHNARDAIIREQWVRSMMSRLVGEELGKCYAREGVNHLEKCGTLRGRFCLSFWDWGWWILDFDLEDRGNGIWTKSIQSWIARALRSVCCHCQMFIANISLNYREVLRAPGRAQD